MDEPILAVDFGTTTSAAILVTDAGSEPVDEPSGRGRTWPSAVFYNGVVLQFGTTAYDSRLGRPDNYRTEFKPDLGGPDPIVLGGREFTPTELVGALLARFRTVAESIAGRPVERAVLTVPVGHRLGAGYHDLMIDAGTAAGFRTVELLAEPVAATLAPCKGTPLEPGSLVLVYDLGGGTFDTALVRLPGAAGDPGEVLGTAGLAGGGRNIDAALYAELVTGARGRLDPWLSSLRGRIRLEDLAVALKLLLSEGPTAELSYGDTDVVLGAQRSQVAAIAAEVIRPTVACVRDLVASCHRSVDDIDAVLLVGGATRMPAVATTLHLELKRPIRRARSEDLAVVMGAARFAAAAGTRRLVAWAPEPDDVPLRWHLPSDHARLIGWAVDDGTEFAAGQSLAQVRLPDGSVWDLRAETDGRVTRRHARVGDTVFDGDWLITGRAVTGPATSPVTA